MKLARVFVLRLGLSLAMFSFTTSASAEIDHLHCAGTYAALGLALPYLPGIFLMFRIVPRSGYAQRIYGQTTPPGEAMPDAMVRAEVERRKKRLMAAFEAGDLTLEDITASARVCDAHYGHDPVPTTLDALVGPS